MCLGSVCDGGLALDPTLNTFHTHSHARTQTKTEPKNTQRRSLLQSHLWQLGRLMSPALCAHLERLGVLPSLYAASWLMTCFSADFPASFSARCALCVLGLFVRVRFGCLRVGAYAGCLLRTTL